MEKAVNYTERCEVIRAMDTLARCINDEEVFYYWLENGVADGDIDETTTNEDLEWYAEDDNYADLMHVFLKAMYYAKKSGGLYSNWVCSESAEA